MTCAKNRPPAANNAEAGEIPRTLKLHPTTESPGGQGACGESGGRVHPRTAALHHAIESGAWASLRPGAMAVYAVLLHHTNWDGVCWPSLATVAVKAGILRQNVPKAVRDLVDAGLVAYQKGGGRDRANEYRVIIAGKQSARTTCFDPRKRSAPADCLAGKQSAQTTETVCADDINSLRPQSPKGYEKSTEKQQQAAAAENSDRNPDRKPDPDALKALRRAGITEPVRSELAKGPGITADVVKDKAEWARREGKSRAILVNELRGVVELAIAKAEEPAPDRRSEREKYRDWIRDGTPATGLKVVSAVEYLCMDLNRYIGMKESSWMNTARSLFGQAFSLAGDRHRAACVHLLALAAKYQGNNDPVEAFIAWSNEARAAFLAAEKYPVRMSPKIASAENTDFVTTRVE